MATLGTRDDAADITTESSEGLASNPLLGKPLGLVNRVKHFWHEIALEMKKVSWPARSEVISTTVIVVIAVFFFAAYLFAADIIFTYIIQGLEWGAQKLFG
jgi:preprotein translocase subunit SecE